MGVGHHVPAGAVTAFIAGTLVVVAFLAGFTDGALLDRGSRRDSFNRHHRHPRCACGAEVPVGTWHTCSGGHDAV